MAVGVTAIPSLHWPYSPRAGTDMEQAEEKLDRMAVDISTQDEVQEEDN